MELVRCWKAGKTFHHSFIISHLVFQLYFLKKSHRINVLLESRDWVLVPPAETGKGHLKWHLNSQACLVYQSALTPDTKLTLCPDKAVFDETVILWGPRSGSSQSLSHPVHLESQHVSWQTVYKPMIGAEDMHQMLKGAWCCPIFKRPEVPL